MHIHILHPGISKKNLLFQFHLTSVNKGDPLLNENLNSKINNGFSTE